MRVFVVMLGEIEVAAFKDFLSARNYADCKNKERGTLEFKVITRYKVT